MNPDPSGEQNRADRTRPHEAVDLPIGDHVKSGDVPVFSCIVYVSPSDGSGVRVRVANLAGLECTAASEREALAKIVPAFKQRVGELIQSETSIPWIEPPAPAEPGEQQRFIPVHL